MYIGLIIIFLTTSLVYAQDKAACLPHNSDVFNYQSPSVKNVLKLDQNLIKTRDQDSIGDCFAYSGADLLETWLKSQNKLKPDEHISAMGIGLISHQEAWVKNLGKLKNHLHEYEESKSQIEKYLAQIELAKFRRSSIHDEIKQIKTKYDNLNPNHAELAKLKNQLQLNSQNGQGTFLPQHKIFFLEKKIESETTANPQYQREIKLLESELFFIREEIKNLNEAISTLKNYLNNFDLLVPEGGNAQESIEKAYNRLCFESEISSRDETLKQLYNEKQDWFKDNLIQPDNLQNALGYLAVFQHAENDKSCDYTYDHFDLVACTTKHITDSLFPGFHQNQNIDFIDVIKNLKPQEDLFDKLISHSCKKRSFSPAPIFAREHVKDILPQGDNSIVLDLLDTALANQKVADISFKTLILDHEDNFPVETDNIKHSNHSSLIVGRLQICNEPYYILRNSWGKQSCKQKRKSFVLTNSNNLNTSYYCDQDGNFIISKKQLQKGLYATTYITN